MQTGTFPLFLGLPLPPHPDRLPIPFASTFSVWMQVQLAERNVVLCFLLKVISHLYCHKLVSNPNILSYFPHVVRLVVLREVNCVQRQTYRILFFQEWSRTTWFL